MRILVCGDRNWNDQVRITSRLAKLGHGHVIVHGAARGADTMAGVAASSLDMSVDVYPADWNKFGRSAGPIRNRQMLDTKPDLVIAFHPNIEASKGTKDCVNEARRRGIPVEVITG